MKHVGHAREKVAKATTMGSGKAMSSMPSGKGKMDCCPKIHVQNKLK